MKFSVDTRRPRNHKSALIKMITKGRWADLNEYLTKYMSSIAPASSQDSGDSIASSIHVTYGAYHNGNVLHVLCENHPPAKIVRQVASMFPLLTVQVNKFKQTPLHIAAKYGASHRVIDVLMKCGGSACLMKDCDGRTPLLLHLRGCSNEKKCDMPSGDWRSEVVNLTSSNQKELHVGPCVKVLRILSEGCPEQVNMCDNFGESPMNFPLAGTGDNNNSRQNNPSSSFSHTLRDAMQKATTGVGPSHRYRSSQGSLAD